MQIASSLPGPLVITVDATSDASFGVRVGSEHLDLSEQLCDLAVLGLVLGAAPGDGVLTAEAVYGTPDAGAVAHGSWELAGVERAVVVTPDGVTVVGADRLGAWAALGVLRALADAPAPR